MTRVLLERYRCCPDMLADFELLGQPSGEPGYFKLDSSLVCYGRCVYGQTEPIVQSSLHDVMPDVSWDACRVVLPFDPSEVIENLCQERYAPQSRGEDRTPLKRAVRSAYYSVRPWLPVDVRKHMQRAALHGWTRLTFPRWPVDTTVDDIHERLLLWSMKATGASRIPFIWFWPNGAQSCVAITHDVETANGYDFCSELMGMDEAYGIKSSFQLVPEGSYAVGDTLLQEIRDRGHEVGVQDLNHDGRLFRDRGEFLARVTRINHYGELFGAKGFRAAVLYRNQSWFTDLKFSYDLSVPNVAHLDPQRGGCCTVMPYFAGGLLEIPLTTTQDYALFNLLQEHSLELWQLQTELILRKNGLITYLIHPDYIVKRQARDTYRNLLAYLQELRSRVHLWFALPGEIDAWWRDRSRMRLVRHKAGWRIEGEGAERAVLAFAADAGDHVEYQFSPQFGVAANGEFVQKSRNTNF
jgi:hypothetical protein